MRVIRTTLTQLDPSHRTLYARRATRYLTKLRVLDKLVRSCLDQVPRAQRKLVTDHDAFGYFARRYGITIVGAVIPSQSTQAQPSAGETAKLIALVRREHVRAIFPEQSLNKRLAQTIAHETGASAEYALYGDTLGPRGSSGETYTSMELANAGEMVRGFSDGRLTCRS